MTNDRSYRLLRPVPTSRLRDADNSIRPHTSGVRVGMCAAVATKPCRPTACEHEHPRRALQSATSVPIPNSSFPTPNCTYTFSAKERDPETGLSYFGSRYYSSDLSIWLSADPQAAKYPSLSPYVYCADNPVRLVDPNGKRYGYMMMKLVLLQ